MTRKELKGAIDTLTPDRETKKEIFLAIEKKTSKPALGGLFRWRRAAVAALAVLLLLVAVPRGFRSALKGAGSSAPESPARIVEEADIVPTQESKSVASYAEAKEEFNSAADDSNGRLDILTYEEGEYQIVEIKGIEDPDALMYLLPENATLIETGDGFQKYKVGEEIWEIRIETGSTRLIKPLK